MDCALFAIIVCIQDHELKYKFKKYRTQTEVFYFLGMGVECTPFAGYICPEFSSLDLTPSASL